MSYSALSKRVDLRHYYKMTIADVCYSV